MTKLSNFLGFINILILVQSSNSFDYKPYDCYFSLDFKIQALLPDREEYLYFYFADRVVRTSRIQIGENYLLQKEEDGDDYYFLIYSEPEFAYISSFSKIVMDTTFIELLPVDAIYYLATAKKTFVLNKTMAYEVRFTDRFAG